MSDQAESCRSTYSDSLPQEDRGSLAVQAAAVLEMAADPALEASSNFAIVEFVEAKIN
jgi:hypothetical protein